MTRRERRRLALTLALSALLALILCLALAAGALGTLQASSYDVLFQTWDDRGIKDAAARAVIVAIDDRSVAEIGLRHGEWPRALYARVVDRLREAYARGIVFDVGFTEPHPDDAEVSAAMARFAALGLEELRAAGLAPSPRSVISPVVGTPDVARRLTPDAPPIYPALLGPQPAYRQVSTALGHVNLMPDADGAIRRIPLLIRVGDEEMPALGLVAAAAYRNRLRWPVTNDPDHHAVQAAGLRIPTTANTQMIISYAGPPSPVDVPAEQTFRTVSFVDVLYGRVSPDVFRDRMVFIGLHSATGLMDAFQVPTSRGRGAMAGVEIHANTFATILAARFFAPQQVPVTMAIVVVICLATGILTARVPILWSAAAAAAGLVGYVLGSLTYATITYEEAGVALPNLVYPSLALIATFITTAVARVVFEQAETRATRSALGKYLSPAILSAVLRDPDQLRLGGEKRIMTVLFSDIRGFTDFAERLEPERLVPLLNEYLGVMSVVVHRWQGVLDKYMGDAIMAWWGAPVPQPDHAYRACMAALEMRAELHVLHGRWKAAGLPPLEMGVGINTGPMVYGNTGSAERFDFTVLGDAVNLASRLEGANKEYGSNVIVSETTRDAVRDTGLVFRFLDVIAVKGKRQPVEIYELLGTADSIGPETRELLPVWESAMALYRSREFGLAEQRFRAVLEASPHDGPAAVYVARCAELRLHPPSEDWDGVFVMTHK